MSADNLLIIIHDRWGLFYKKKLLERFFKQYNLQDIKYDGELIIIKYSDRPQFGATIPFELSENIQKWIYKKELSTVDGETQLQILYNDEQEGEIKNLKFENDLKLIKQKMNQIKNNNKAKIVISIEIMNKELDKIKQINKELQEMN